MRTGHPLPPGPRPRFLIGNLLEFRQDPLAFLAGCARDYGDVARYRIGAVNVYLLNHPDLIEYVLVKHSRDFIKGRLFRANRLLFGNGLLTSEGDDWLRRRRWAQPAFHRERINAHAEVLVAMAERWLGGWRPDEQRDIYLEMKNLTRAIVAKTLFDADVSGEAEAAGAALQIVGEEFSARINTGLLIPEPLPTPGNLRLRKAVRRLDEIVYGLIRQRRLAGQDRGDLLSMLLAARADDGAQMADGELRDEVMTLFVAGHETTAAALTWTWFLLARHPEVETRLLAELQRVLGGRAPTALDMPRLPYTEMVIRESLRLYPPVWGLPRVALRDCEIGGYYVPAGTSLTMSQWVMHHDRRYFDDPDEFRPERWSGDVARQLPAFAYFPFGGGPRQCIGYSFAMLQAVLLVATIATRFRFTLVPEHPVQPWPSLVLYPKFGIRVIVQPRLPVVDV